MHYNKTVDNIRRLKLKNNSIIILFSFLVPIAIMAFAFYEKGIYPGGTYTILTSDLGAQYMPFYASLRYILKAKSDNSLFLSMSGALGNNFMGFAYYIFSPFAWFTVLFPLEQLPDAIYFITLLRIGMCGACFACYLIYSYYDKQYKLAVFLLSCCYALTSYNVGYSINLMWLDAVFMLPLILLGIEKTLRERKTTFLILSISISLILNYYITFMSIIFSICYLLVRLVEINKLRIRNLFLFALYYVIGMGMAAPVLIPAVLALRAGKMEEGAKEMSSLFRYRLVDVLGQFLSGKFDTLFDDGLPMIFCGTATIVLAILYFALSKDKIIHKLVWLMVISFYMFSMCFIPLDRAMHGFKETTCFETRYSYVVCCMFLILAYRGVDVVSDKLAKRSLWKYIKVMFMFLVFVELYLNSSIMIAGIISEMGYGLEKDYDDSLKTKTELLGKIEDNDFYRISDYSAYTFNDGAWLGYNGIGYFSSSYNLSVMNFLGLLGEDHSYHILKEGDRTPVEESLLGVKYRLSYLGWNDTEKVLATDGVYSVSENVYALSLGYMIDLPESGSIKAFSKNAFENQNTVIRELSGSDEEPFVELEQLRFEEFHDTEYAIHRRFEVEAVCDAPIWVYFEKGDTNIFYNINKETKLLINGEDFGSFVNSESDSTFMIYLGRYSAGEQINVDILSNVYYETCHVNYIDEEVYHDIINRLDNNQLALKEHSSGHFTGIIDAGQGGQMLLSLPKMDGWIIKVDGKKVSYKYYRDALILVSLSGGEHTIDIRFISPGIYISLILCGLSLIVCLYFTRNKNQEFGIVQ